MIVQHAALNDIFKALSAALPELSEVEQQVAVELYRQLARGAPVGRERLAAALTLPSGEVDQLLDGGGLTGLVFYDDERLVIGFGGLAVVPMAHRFTVNGTTLYTWCAWDGLFLPEILGVSADIETTCPHTGATIRLTVTPDSVNSVDPMETVVSFLLPDAPLFENTTAESIQSFCHYIYFLASPGAGAEWTKAHEGTFVLSLEDAFQLGRMNNTVRFGKVLGSANA